MTQLIVFLLLCSSAFAQSIRIFDTYLDPAGGATAASCTINGGATKFSRVTAGVIDWTVPALTAPSIYTVVCSWFATGTTTTEYWRPLASNGSPQTLSRVRLGSTAGPLTVTPSGTRTTRAGGSTLTYQSSTLATWSLTGVGSITATSAAETTYTPPLVLSIGATVTLTATAGGVTVTRSITVSPFAATYFSETLVGSNGVNLIYNLTAVPAIGSLIVTRNGLVLANGVDFSLSGLTLTFASGLAPDTGDVLRAYYVSAASLNP